MLRYLSDVGVSVVYLSHVMSGWKRGKRSHAEGMCRGACCCFLAASRLPAMGATMTGQTSFLWCYTMVCTLSNLAPSPLNIIPLNNISDQYCVQVEYPRYMSEASVSFVSSLLCHEVADRLGSGPMGKENIKSHAFMGGTHSKYVRTRRCRVEPERFTIFHPETPKLQRFTTQV